MMIPCVKSRECDAVRGMASLGRLGRSALGRARRGRGQQLTAIDRSEMCPMEHMEQSMEMSAIITLRCLLGASQRWCCSNVVSLMSIHH